MSVALRVDPSDPTPPFEQVRRQIATAIESGALEAGTRLPTVRQLADDLGLAPGTVMRAYAELEASGLLTTRRGAGTTVTAGAPRSGEAELRARLNDLAVRLVAQARLLGVADADILAAVRQALA